MVLAVVALVLVGVMVAVACDDMVLFPCFHT